MMVVVVLMMVEIVTVLCTSGHRLKIVFIIRQGGFASSNISVVIFVKSLI
jgi:hypothetical protein